MAICYSSLCVSLFNWQLNLQLFNSQCVWWTSGHNSGCILSDKPEKNYLLLKCAKPKGLQFVAICDTPAFLVVSIHSSAWQFIMGCWPKQDFWTLGFAIDHIHSVCWRPGLPASTATTNGYKWTIFSSDLYRVWTINRNVVKCLNKIPLSYNCASTNLLPANDTCIINNCLFHVMRCCR